MILKKVYPEITKAIKNNDIASLDALFKKHPDSIVLLTPFGSWLHYAANKSSVSTLKVLVDFGVDPGIRVKPMEEYEVSEDGLSAIVPAAEAGKVENVKYFLQLNVELDTHTPSANPLFGAVHGHSVEITKLLLESGIDASVRYSGSKMDDMDDMDAMAFAFEFGQTEIADVLALHLTAGDVEKANALKAERYGKGRPQ